MSKIYKILFLSTLSLSTLVSISSYTWLGMWMGLEINLLSIIPLMYTPKNILSAESSMKYFIVQAIASTIILLSIILMMEKTSLLSSMSLQSAPLLAMNSSFLTKMGMAPFHFWFPEVMEGLDWFNCLLILTWQKIAPMILLMYNMKFTMFLSIIIITATIISGTMGINQISMRKILAYSSISHMSWMISTMMIMETIWMYYFLVYSVITINLSLIFKKMKTFFLNQLFQSMGSKPMMKMFFILNFLSLSGMPPFLGFLPKWLTIQALVQKEMIFLPITMILFTLITIFMYIRMTLTALLMNNNETNWKMNLSLPNLKSFVLALTNFISITSLAVITILFNIL